MRLFGILAFLATVNGISFALGHLDTLDCDVHHLPSQEALDEYVGALDGGCSLACAFGWTITPASTLKPQGGISYSATNLSDANLQTAWVEGEADYGVGVAFRITFNNAGVEQAVPLNGFAFINGYAKNKSIWSANSRVRLLEVMQNGKHKFTLRLADTVDPQSVSLEGPQIMRLRPGDDVTLVIRGVYPGTKFKDTALTEINLYGAH